MTFYGELVIPYHQAENSGMSAEASIMEDQVRLMIEEAAYYLAEKRGFAPGYELQDWIEAEKAVRKD